MSIVATGNGGRSFRKGLSLVAGFVVSATPLLDYVFYMAEQTKKCSKCLAEIPKKASKCSHCGSAQGDGIKNLIYIGIIVFAAIFIFGGSSDSPTSTNSTENATRDNSTMAYVQAKNYVRSVLKSPSSADFPFSSSGTNIGDDTYRVSSHVDSQNSFGATIRSNYTITLKYNGGDSADQNNWFLEELIFDGEDVTASAMTQQDRKLQACMEEGETRDMCLTIFKAFD